MMTMINPSLTACTIADVQPDGQVVEQLDRISGTGIIFGPVRTALCAPNDNLGVREVMEHLRPGEILVLGSMQPTPRHCFLGDNLALFAKLRGAAGIIVDGYVRDTEGLREVGLSVHARGSKIFARSSKAGPFDLAAPVIIDGVEFATGDFLAADGDVITRVPSGHVDEVLQAAAAKLHGEEAIKRLLIDGFSLQEAVEQISRAGSPAALKP